MRTANGLSAQGYLERGEGAGVALARRSGLWAHRERCHPLEHHADVVGAPRTADHLLDFDV